MFWEKPKRKDALNERRWLAGWRSLKRSNGHERQTKRRRQWQWSSWSVVGDNRKEEEGAPVVSNVRQCYQMRRKACTVVLHWLRILSAALMAQQPHCGRSHCHTAGPPAHLTIERFHRCQRKTLDGAGKKRSRPSSAVEWHRSSTIHQRHLPDNNEKPFASEWVSVCAKAQQCTQPKPASTRHSGKSATATTAATVAGQRSH